MNTEETSKNTFMYIKNPNFESLDELCSKLSFTVENKISNSHKIRLFTSKNWEKISIKKNGTLNPVGILRML